MHTSVPPFMPVLVPAFLHAPPSLFAYTTLLVLITVDTTNATTTATRFMLKDIRDLLLRDAKPPQGHRAHELSSGYTKSWVFLLNDVSISQVRSNDETKPTIMSVVAERKRIPNFDTISTVIDRLSVEVVKKSHFEFLVETGALVAAEATKKIDLQDAMIDRKSTRLNSSHVSESRMPSSA